MKHGKEFKTWRRHSATCMEYLEESLIFRIKEQGNRILGDENSTNQMKNSVENTAFTIDQRKKNITN
jgi:hypothetical protein